MEFSLTTGKLSHNLFLLHCYQMQDRRENELVQKSWISKTPILSHLQFFVNSTLYCIYTGSPFKNHKISLHLLIKLKILSTVLSLSILCTFIWTIPSMFLWWQRFNQQIFNGFDFQYVFIV